MTKVAVVQRFIEEECSAYLGADGSQSYIYAVFRNWVRGNSIEDAPRKGELFTILGELGYPAKDGRLRDLAPKIQFNPDHILKANVEIIDDKILFTLTAGWKPWVGENFRQIPGAWFHGDAKPKYWSFPVSQRYAVDKVLRYIDVTWL